MPSKTSLQKTHSCLLSQRYFFCSVSTINLKKTKKNHLCFLILGIRALTRALQSSPFQNPKGSPEHYGGRTNERTNEILVSNIGYDDYCNYIGDNPEFIDNVEKEPEEEEES